MAPALVHREKRCVGGPTILPSTSYRMNHNHARKRWKKTSFFPPHLRDWPVWHPVRRLALGNEHHTVSVEAGGDRPFPTAASHQALRALSLIETWIFCVAEMRSIRARVHSESASLDLKAAIVSCRGSSVTRAVRRAILVRRTSALAKLISSSELESMLHHSFRAVNGVQLPDGSLFNVYFTAADFSVATVSSAD